MRPCHLSFPRNPLPKSLLAANRGSGAWLSAFCLEFSLTLLLLHPALGIMRNHRQQRPLEMHHSGILALNPVYIFIQFHVTPQTILTPKQCNQWRLVTQCSQHGECLMTWRWHREKVQVLRIVNRMWDMIKPRDLRQSQDCFQYFYVVAISRI